MRWQWIRGRRRREDEDMEEESGCALLPCTTTEQSISRWPWFLLLLSFCISHSLHACLAFHSLTHEDERGLQRLAAYYRSNDTNAWITQRKTGQTQSQQPLLKRVQVCVCCCPEHACLFSSFHWSALCVWFPVWDSVAVGEWEERGHSLPQHANTLTCLCFVTRTVRQADRMWDAVS